MELLFGGDGHATMLGALRRLIGPDVRLSIAVSFLQVSGWEKLRALLAPQACARTRVVCDDRMGITNPEAVRRMLAAGIDVRAYAGEEIYHPKIYLALGNGGAPDRALIGSANLSEPALISSVEAGLLFDDNESAVAAWFDELFENRSAVFDAARMAKLEEAFRRRLKGDLVARRAALVPTAAPEPADVAARSLVDRVFSGLGDYVAPLSFDQGKNNVRNLAKACELVKARAASWSGVQVAELKFSGLAIDRALTPLGQSLANAPDFATAVQFWTRWLKSAPEADLPERKYNNLVVARRAIAAFCKMKPDVREFFMARAVENDFDDRPMLQAIELLANAGTVGSELELAEVRALAPLITDPTLFSSNVTRAVRTYIENKASRSWGLPERRLLLEAWQNTK